jgi:hypothetical protein
MKQEAIKKVVYFGERYKNEYLQTNAKKKETFEREWYGGLSLLLSYSFLQGRLDKVSEMVEKKARAVLDKYFRGRDLSAMKTRDFDSLLAQLLTVIGKGKVGKARDAHMVVEIFRFVSRLPEENLSRYSVSTIKKDTIQKLYNELNNIMGVGPKIACLYLRDLVDIYDLEANISQEDLRFLQPIDVWVRKVACKVGLVSETEPDVNIQNNIVRVCNELGISSLRFNQGAWYLGKNALDIVVKNLEIIQ